MTAVSLNILRIALGVLAALFALQLGRVLLRLQKQKLPFVKALTWILRVAVCTFAVAFRHGFDRITIGSLAAIAVMLAIGAYLEWRPKHVEETHLFNE